MVKGAGANHTYALTVRLHAVPQGLDTPEKVAEFLRGQRGKLSDMHRFEAVSHSEAPMSHLGRPCSRYRLAVQDKGVLAYAPLFLNNAGLTCTHPAKADLVVDVGYSERGGRNEFSQDLAATGERFIGSLRFFQGGERPGISKAAELAAAGDFDGVKRELAPLADGGDLFTAMRLGQMLLRSPSEADQALARKYLEAAAADGFPDALYNLGVAHEKALGGSRDVEKAVYWFTRAADQRDASAQFNLGVLHHPRGSGVVKDINVATQWFRMAADNGHEAARKFVGR